MSGNINFNGWINDDGSENYKCRAWVNFNGTGTVAIRASGNVSSITDNGVGLYTVNFTTAMPDANYCINTTMGMLGSSNSSNSVAMINDISAVPTTSAVRIGTSFASTGTAYDAERIQVAIFR